VTLVDTSVWVDHLRRRSPELQGLLEGGEVLCHPFIIGELACGSMSNRNEIIALLRCLPAAPIADDEEVMSFLNDKRLWGRGLGWIDLHLLTSAALGRVRLWTRDRALKQAAERLSPTS
jgi:predicted nucleic acid-binding protein